VSNISDDVIVFGRNIREHNRNLLAVIKRLADSGLTLGQSKCELSKTETDFYGHRFSAKGVEIHPKHKAHVANMDRPTNVSEVRSLLSMVSYSARFIPNMSSIRSHCAI